MQRIDGETSLHQLAAQKDKVAELEHSLTQILELSQRESEHFGGERTDIAERAKETLTKLNNKC